MKIIVEIKHAMKNVPAQSINFFLFCLSGVLIFVFGGIIPGQRTRALLDDNIRKAKYRLEEYDALLPIYISLQRSSGSVASPALALPKRVVLPKSQINKADSSFRDIAGRFGMKVVSVVPDLTAFSGDARTMSISMSLHGDFANFRPLLKELNALPYVDHIEEFAIQRSGNMRALDFTLKIVLAVS